MGAQQDEGEQLAAGDVDSVGLGLEDQLLALQDAPEPLAPRLGVLREPGLQVEGQLDDLLGGGQPDGLLGPELEVGDGRLLGLGLRLKIVQTRDDGRGAVAVGDELHEAGDAGVGADEPGLALLELLRPLGPEEERLLRQSTSDAEVEAWAQMVVKPEDRLRPRPGKAVRRRS